MKNLRIGICGWGNIATGLYKTILENKDEILNKIKDAPIMVQELVDDIRNINKSSMSNKELMINLENKIKSVRFMQILLVISILVVAIFGFLTI